MWGWRRRFVGRTVGLYLVVVVVVGIASFAAEQLKPLVVVVNLKGGTPVVR